MFKEFRDFIARGNVLDLAVAVIIGAAFGTIVTSLTDDLIMPIIGFVTGGVDFSNKFVGLSSAVTAPGLAAAREQGPVLAYGNFITLVINFLIIAWVLFMVIKLINRLKKAEPAAAEAPPAQEVLLGEIRDLLKKK